MHPERGGDSRAVFSLIYFHFPDYISPPAFPATQGRGFHSRERFPGTTGVCLTFLLFPPHAARSQAQKGAVCPFSARGRMPGPSSSSPCPHPAPSQRCMAVLACAPSQGGDIAPGWNVVVVVVVVTSTWSPGMFGWEKPRRPASSQTVSPSVTSAGLWNPPGNGDSPPALGSLFQCFPTLSMKEFSRYPTGTSPGTT